MSEVGNISISNPRPCGECTLCCKLFALPELNKAAGEWCRHCVPGKGCSIHATRPQGCRIFQCGWSVLAPLDETWRPDVAGFVLGLDDTQISVDVDPATPDAWRREPYYAQLKKWSQRNGPRVFFVIVRIAGRAIMLFPEADIDLGMASPGAEIESGYAMMGGHPTPYARWVQ